MSNRKIFPQIQNYKIINLKIWAKRKYIDPDFLATVHLRKPRAETNARGRFNSSKMWYAEKGTPKTCFWINHPLEGKNVSCNYFPGNCWVEGEKTSYNGCIPPPPPLSLEALFQKHKRLFCSFLAERNHFFSWWWKNFGMRRGGHFFKFRTTYDSILKELSWNYRYIEFYQYIYNFRIIPLLLSIYYYQLH